MQDGDRMRVAGFLEGFMIEVEEKVLEQDPPEEIRKLVKEVLDPEWEPFPIGLGKQEDVGWFIVASGQGPCIQWLEREPDMSVLIPKIDKAAKDRPFLNMV